MLNSTNKKLVVLAMALAMTALSSRTTLASLAPGMVCFEPTLQQIDEEIGLALDEASIAHPKAVINEEGTTCLLKSEMPVQELNSLVAKVSTAGASGAMLPDEVSTDDAKTIGLSEAILSDAETAKIWVKIEKRENDKTVALQKSRENERLRREKETADMRVQQDIELQNQKEAEAKMLADQKEAMEQEIARKKSQREQQLAELKSKNNAELAEIRAKNEETLAQISAEKRRIQIEAKAKRDLELAETRAEVKRLRMEAKYQADEAREAKRYAQQIDREKSRLTAARKTKSELKKKFAASKLLKKKSKFYAKGKVKPGKRLVKYVKGKKIITRTKSYKMTASY